MPKKCGDRVQARTYTAVLSVFKRASNAVQPCGLLRTSMAYAYQHSTAHRKASQVNHSGCSSPG